MQVKNKNNETKKYCSNKKKIKNPPQPSLTVKLSSIQWLSAAAALYRLNVNIFIYSLDGKERYTSHFCTTIQIEWWHVTSSSKVVKCCKGQGLYSSYKFSLQRVQVPVCRQTSICLSELCIRLKKRKMQKTDIWKLHRLNQKKLKCEPEIFDWRENLNELKIKVS